jgi:Tfp pilus assembly protein PilF
MPRRSRAKTARPQPPPRHSWLARASAWLVPAVVVAATFVVFLPGLDGEFVTWDDDRNFLMNEAYRGLGPTQLAWMWTTFHLGPYQPLSWMSLGLDYVFYGMAPLGYHVTSLLIHVVNAWLVYVLAMRVLRAGGLQAGGPKPAPPMFDVGLRVAAGVAALLFAIHPLRVESVSWVTERRDVLSGLFLVLSLLAYFTLADLKRRGQAATKWLVWTVLLFTLSLLAKASAMALAGALIAIDLWWLRRHEAGPANPNPVPLRALLIEKIPFAVIGVAIALVAAVGQRTMDAIATMDGRGPVQRIARGFYGLVFYLWKSIWPIELSNLYEVPFRLNAFDWHFLLAATVVVAITIATFLFRRRYPAILTAWLSYAVLILPVSGIAHSGGQIVADRYSYQPCLAWALLAGGGVLVAWRAVQDGRIGRRLGRATAVAIVATLIALGTLASLQTRVWHDSITLWQRALALHPIEQLRRAGRDAEVRTYEATLRQLGNVSGYWVICYNLGFTLRSAGRHAEAADIYARGVAAHPANADLKNGWAAALIELKRYDEAALRLDEAIADDARHAKAHFNLGIVRAAQGRSDDAMAAYRRSIALDPSSAESHYNLGVLLAAADRLVEAETEYRAAIALKAPYAEAYNNLGVALVRQGRTTEAVEAFRKSLSINPSNPSAEKNLAQALGILKGR